MRVAVPAARVQFALTAAAFLALMRAFVTSDFSVRLVASNSHSMKPMLYKVAGTWGNHEGSMLLWMLILTLFGAMVAWWGKNLPPPLKARVLAVQATIAVAFFGFILFTSNPFVRLPIRRSTATTSIRCSRTPASPSTRPSSTSATSASRWPIPSPSPR